MQEFPRLFFKNNRNLLVMFGGILESLLAVFMGSNVDDVYASTGTGNSTAPQTLNLTEALDIQASKGEI